MELSRLENKKNTYKGGRGRKRDMDGNVSDDKEEEMELSVVGDD